MAARDWGVFASSICFVAAVVGFAPSSRADTADPAPDLPGHAVVLKSEIIWSVEPWTKHSSIDYHAEILIRDPEGFDNANQLVTYSKETKVAKFSAQTIQPDGSSVPLSDSMRHERVLLREGRLRVNSLQFTFPAVRPGSVLSYSFQLSTSSAPYALPMSGGWWEVQLGIPVAETSLTVKIHQTDNIKYVASTAGDFWSKKSCKRDELHEPHYGGWTTTCKAIPAFEPEPNSPPSDDLRVRMFVCVGIGSGTGADWNSWGHLEGKGLGGYIFNSKKLAVIADQWKGQDLSEADKLRVVSSWVRENIALVDDFSDNLDDAIDHRAGTSFERNILAAGLLLRLGLQPKLALLADSSIAAFKESVPDYLSADRLFVVFGDNNAPRYFDVNCDYCAPGVPPPEYLGPNAGGILFTLVVPDQFEEWWGYDTRRMDRAAKSWFANTRPVPARNNSEIVKRTVVLDANGNAETQGEFRWQTQFDALVREQWLSMTPSGREAHCRETARIGQAEIAVKVSDPADITAPLTCSFTAKEASRAIRLGNKLLIRPGLETAQLLSLPSQVEREQPLRFSFARAVQWTEEFKLPEGSKLLAIPDPLTVSTVGLRFHAAWTAGEEPGTLRFSALMMLEALEFPPSEFPHLRSLVAKAASYLAGGFEVEVQP